MLLPTTTSRGVMARVHAVARLAAGHVACIDLWDEAEFGRTLRMALGGAILATRQDAVVA